MKKHIVVILLTVCSLHAFSQKTIHVTRADANSVLQIMEDNSKVATFSITGFTSEHQARVTEMFLRSYRGVIECNFTQDSDNGNWYGTLKAYKYANEIYFSNLLQKAGIANVEVDNRIIPVENLKTIKL